MSEQSSDAPIYPMTSSEAAETSTETIALAVAVESSSTQEESRVVEALEVKEASSTYPAYSSASDTVTYTPTLETYFNEEKCRLFLAEQQWPTGLVDEYVRGLSACPMRFFLIDDSGSMNASDATRLIRKGNTAVPVVSTRWAELVETIRFHANLTDASKALTEFRLLNYSSPITLGAGNDSPSALNTLMSALKEPPNGLTPLCRHVRDIVGKISSMEPSLRASGKKVKLIIATDGEASDGNLAEAMRPLRYLPVWIVVRLCTNNEAVSNYWANIDAELELNMDVVQNITAESAEIHVFNPWLNYSEPLHRLREGGLSQKEVDFLDEAKLSGEQILAVVILIFGSRYASLLPHPDVDFNSFLAILKDAEAEVPHHLNPVTKVLAPQIDLRALRSHLGKGLLRSLGSSFFGSSKALRA